MARNVFNVIVEKVISALRVKVRNDADDVSWQIDSNGRGVVSAEGVKPDGANLMPSGHDKNHPIYGLAVESAPTDSSKSNGSLTFTWTNGLLTRIRLTTGGSSYDRTLTWSGNEMQSISSWGIV
jgi:hypothetical protein